MSTKNTRISAAVLCALGLLLYFMAGLLTPASAAAAETGSLTLVCESDGMIMAGMDWNIYRIGSHLDTGEFVLEGDFAEYPVSFEDLSVSAIQDAANTLENYAKLDGIMPIASGVTADDGTLTFEGLEKGLYLLSGEKITLEGSVCTPAAAIVEIKADENGSYDLTVNPKFEIEEPVPTPSEYSVSKVWAGDENTNARPDSIVVDIFADGELAETVTLNEDNGWAYSWTSENAAEWSVEERDVPAGYKVVYRGNGADFEIVNTYENSSSTAGGTDSKITSVPDTTSSVPEKIPQTGQLWWPVPVLSIAGLVLIAIGWRLHSKKEND